VSNLDRPAGEHDELAQQVDALRSAVRHPLALDRLYEAVLAYAAQHRLAVDEATWGNVMILTVAGVRVEFRHDDGEHRRYVAVADERPGYAAYFDEVPPSHEELLGVIDRLRASNPNTPN
jgi:hypothetical protein